MKKTKVIILTALLTIVTVTILTAANFKNEPATIKQPDGTVIQCLVSGDEFFNYLHDADGFTIIQGQDGWFYYATKNAEQEIIPSQYIAGQIDPASVGLQKHVKLTQSQYQKKVDRFFEPLKDNSKSGINIGKAPATGTFNNIVVYIHFADDPEFTNTRQTYINLFTGSGGATYSVQEYFLSVSYNQITVNAEHFPVCQPTTNISFQDSHDRGYFQPYNAVSNPIGYQDDNEARLREHQLLVDAVNYTKAEIESNMTANEIDLDSDGYVDNMSFIIYGNSDGWSDLLWAHRWALYTYVSTIHGKRVWDYTFQPENQCTARTTCHELFHCMGSPDLYHYTDNGVDPVWYWDLMEFGSGSMTAYMKEQIGGWISIPVISSSGNYSLSPLSGSSNNAYKISLPNSPTEFLIIEYRKKVAPVESKLPASADEGLLVYRINTNVSINVGNRNGPPDMLYVYRPNGDTDTQGNPNDATFSSTQGRTSFTDVSNPACVLSDDVTWGGITITNVGAVGSTIDFTVTIPGTGQTTKLTNDYCNSSSNTANYFIYCDPVAGAEDYQFRFVNSGAGFDQSKTTSAVWGSAYGYRNYLKLSNIPNIKYGLIYNVTVRAKVAGQWTDYGTVCQFTLHGTKLQNAYCGITVNNTNTTIYADGISGATDYEFKFVNSGAGFNESRATSSVWGPTYGYRNYLKVQNIPNIQYGLTYNVQVRALVSGIWSEYYTTCQLTVGGTKLRDDFCDVTISNSNTLIYCDGISGTTNYEFRFTNTVTYAQNSRTTVSVWGGAYGYRNYLRMYYIPGLQWGATYDVDVRAYINGTWTSYGTVCQITYGPGAKNLSAENYPSELTINSILLYPNPVEEFFNIEFLSEGSGRYDLEVLDVSGRMIFSETGYIQEAYYIRQKDVTALENGLYFVKVIFGEESKVLKFYKE